MDDAGNTKDDMKLPLEDELAKEARGNAAHACGAGRARYLLACRRVLAAHRPRLAGIADAERLPHQAARPVSADDVVRLYGDAAPGGDLLDLGAHPRRVLAEGDRAPAVV